MDSYAANISSASWYFIQDVKYIIYIMLLPITYPAIFPIKAVYINLIRFATSLSIVCIKNYKLNMTSFNSRPSANSVGNGLIG